jgi:cell division protein FtsB
MEADLIGWREAGVLLIVGVSVYLFFTLYKLLKLSRRKPAKAFLTPSAAEAAEAAPRRDDFHAQLAEHLKLAELEREVRQLRAEVEKLQQELKELKAARFVAPQYGEALALAQRGFSAQQIADRMGIALAEAELVLALSRGESAFAEGKLDEAIDLEQQGE